MHWNNNFHQTDLIQERTQIFSQWTTKSPKSFPAHELMKDASMGSIGKEKKDFYDMILKNAITKKTILNVPILFDETDLEYNQPFG